MKTVLIIVLSLITLSVLGDMCHTNEPTPRECFNVENIDFDFTKWYADADQLKAECNFPTIPWQDDVFNPENQEYLLEVCFNEDIYPDNISPVELQWYFIDRYYDTCDPSSQEWYDWMTTYLGDE